MPVGNSPKSPSSSGRSTKEQPETGSRKVRAQDKEVKKTAMKKPGRRKGELTPAGPDQQHADRTVNPDCSGLVRSIPKKPSRSVGSSGPRRTCATVAGPNAGAKPLREKWVRAHSTIAQGTPSLSRGGRKTGLSAIALATAEGCPSTKKKPGRRGRARSLPTGVRLTTSEPDYGRNQTYLAS